MTLRIEALQALWYGDHEDKQSQQPASSPLKLKISTDNDNKPEQPAPPSATSPLKLRIDEQAGPETSQPQPSAPPQVSPEQAVQQQLELGLDAPAPSPALLEAPGAPDALPGQPDLPESAAPAGLEAGLSLEGPAALEPGFGAEPEPLLPAEELGILEPEPLLPIEELGASEPEPLLPAEELGASVPESLLPAEELPGTQQTGSELESTSPLGVIAEPDLPPLDSLEVGGGFPGAGPGEGRGLGVPIFQTPVQGHRPGLRGLFFEFFG